VSNSIFPYEAQDAVISGLSSERAHNPAHLEKTPGEIDFEKTGPDGIPETGAYTNGIMGL